LPAPVARNHSSSRLAQLTEGIFLPGQLLGVSASTVNRRLIRGLELLAEVLSDFRPDDEIPSSI
jgi:hypothetical protein